PHATRGVDERQTLRDQPLHLLRFADVIGLCVGNRAPSPSPPSRGGDGGCSLLFSSLLFSGNFLELPGISRKFRESTFGALVEPWLGGVEADNFIELPPLAG